MFIPLVNLKRQHEELEAELRSAIDKVIKRTDFVLGAEVRAFEEEFAAYCGVRHCIGVGSGLDALNLALRGLGIGQGDEVILAANSDVETAIGVIQAGATPVLVDHDSDTYNLSVRGLSMAVTPRTKAIVPTHRYGQPADMDAIQIIADEHGLCVLEDAGHAHGARYNGHRCGCLGCAASFGFQPDSQLGAMGDGGAVVTNDDDLARWLRASREYGSRPIRHRSVRGWSSRLDNIQAAVLRIKLRHLDEWNERRRQVAEWYAESLGNCGIILPQERADRSHTFHRFVVRCASRDAVLHRLGEHGIDVVVHDPIPIHRHEAIASRCIVPMPAAAMESSDTLAGSSLRNAERSCQEVLSLPMCPYLTSEEVSFVARHVSDEMADFVR